MANGSRQAAALTQVKLGSRAFVSGGYIGQFEQDIRSHSWMSPIASTGCCKPTVFRAVVQEAD
ncbi:hypothetical protein ACFU3E_28075 [Streptomyces sp. NPDC057424]|uniref:hypothetical protein n=1 Tax=Streptomyces sp. NPDC057424 TaxID=3346127 RepID=UPI0036CD0C75